MVKIVGGDKEKEIGEYQCNVIVNREKKGGFV